MAVVKEYTEAEVREWKDKIYAEKLRIMNDKEFTMKWIPESQSHPDKSGDYLITDKCGRVKVAYWYDTQQHWEGFDNCIAWCELPVGYGTIRG